MKGRLTCCMTMIAVLIPMLCKAQPLVFSVKPGFGVQSSHFGLSMGQITPYFGLDLLNIGVKGDYNDVDWRRDWWTGTLYKYHEEHIDISGSATLFIPHIGMKFHLADENKHLRPYLAGDLFKAFAFVNVEGTEVDKYYDLDGTLTDVYVDEYGLEKNEETLIEDLLGVWGFVLAFGADYSFSDRFSIGGEYGLRMFFSSGDYQGRDSGDWDNDGIDDWREQWDGELSGTLKMTYAAIVLNFRL